MIFNSLFDGEFYFHIQLALYLFKNNAFEKKNLSHRTIKFLQNIFQ